LVCFTDAFHDLLLPVIQSLSGIGVQTSPSVVDMRRTVWAPGNETMFGYDFLRLAVTSHLQVGANGLHFLPCVC
jgi:hypothetical protein